MRGHSYFKVTLPILLMAEVLLCLSVEPGSQGLMLVQQWSFEPVDGICLDNTFPLKWAL